MWPDPMAIHSTAVVMTRHDGREPINVIKDCCGGKGLPACRLENRFDCSRSRFSFELS